MPKAKVKRKGAVVPLFEGPTEAKKICLTEEDESQAASTSASTNVAPTFQPTHNISRTTILDLPEDVILLILVKLDLLSVCSLEQSCSHMHHLIRNARVWRRLLIHKIDIEPGLTTFLPKHLHKNFSSLDLDHSSYKKMFGDIQTALRQIWKSTHKPNVTRSPKIFGQLVEKHVPVQIVTSGKYFAAFYMNQEPEKAEPYVDIVDVFDRSTDLRVLRLDVPAKPDNFRIVDQLKLFLMSYPKQLKVEIVSLEREDKSYIDLMRPGEAESGSVCDIVVREHINYKSVTHRYVVMVAMNTEPIENNQFHIGEIQFFSLNKQGYASAIPLTRVQFHPVPHQGGKKFFNQCIQKKGLSDFNEDHVVVVVGGSEGSSVLGVVSMQKNKLVHRLLLKAPNSDREGGCEGGFCQFSVVSLMIDRCETSTCSVLLSTGQLIVINLNTGTTIFHKHLHFDGQLKLALQQPGFLGDQILAIKFRNYIEFHKLRVKRSMSGSLRVEFDKLRTITSVDADGRETKCDDNPTQELKRQFGELQKSLRALNSYTSGITKKLAKGLRPGTVTQGVMSMTKKVQTVTCKLDQAHDKAREIESVVIDSIAFDNRYCHALTLTRDLVTFDLAGSLDSSGEITNTRNSAASASAKPKQLHL